MAQSKVKYYQLDLAGKIVKGDLLASLESNLIYADGTHAFTANQSMGGNKLTGLATPTTGTDAATKAYVDAAVQGLDVKQSVRVASSINVNIASPSSTIDGVSLSTGDRVLLMAQTNATENGIYTFNGTGSTMTRSTDADTNAKVTPGMFTFVEEGTNADAGYVLITDGAVVLGVTNLTFTQFSGAGSITASNGLTKTSSNVELGGALTKNTTLSGSFGLTFSNGNVAFAQANAFNTNESSFSPAQAILYTHASNSSYTQLTMDSSIGNTYSKLEAKDGTRAQIAEIYTNAGTSVAVNTTIQVKDGTTLTQLYIDNTGIKLGRIAASTFKGIKIDTTNAQVTIDDLAGFANYLVKVDAAGKLQLVNPATLAYTANNGLTLASSNVKLGGSLIENTTITMGNFNMAYSLSGTGVFSVSNGTDTIFNISTTGINLTKGTGSTTLSVAITNGSLSYTSTGGNMSYGLIASGDNSQINFTLNPASSETTGLITLSYSNAAGTITSRLDMANSKFKITSSTNGISYGDSGQPAGELSLTGTTVKIAGPTTVTNLAGNTDYLVRVDVNGKLLTVNPANYTYAASNGLTMVSNTTRLGGALTQATAITSTGTTNLLTFTGDNTAGFSLFKVTTTGDGTASHGKSTNGIGIVGETVNGTGVNGFGTGGTSVGGAFTGGAIGVSATGNIGVYGSSPLGKGFVFEQNNFSSTNSITILGSFKKNPTAVTPADGYGLGLDFLLGTTTTVDRQAGKISFKWSTAADATRTSSLEIQTTNSGTAANKLELFGTGQMKLNTYGAGTFTGTPAYFLTIDSSGNLIETLYTSGGGGGSYTAANGISIDGSNIIKLGGSVLTENALIGISGSSQLTIAQDPDLFVNGMHLSSTIWGLNFVSADDGGDSLIAEANSDTFTISRNKGADSITMITGAGAVPFFTVMLQNGSIDSELTISNDKIEMKVDDGSGNVADFYLQSATNLNLTINTNGDITGISADSSETVIYGAVKFDGFTGASTRFATISSTGYLQTASYSSVLASVWVFKEVPTGSVNGTNTVFAIANAQVTNSEHVYLNGILQKATDDYTVSGTNITFTFAPETGDKILVTYLKS